MVNNINPCGKTAQKEAAGLYFWTALTLNLLRGEM